jgi:small-conductance mechanosensitive channel
VRYAILLVGAVTILVLGAGLMKFPIGQLLVGGAVTTILLGIGRAAVPVERIRGPGAAPVRPFTVRDYIRLKSGALGGVTDGLVAEIGITYVRLDTEDGTLHLPNSQVLAAAVGPIARPGPGIRAGPRGTDTGPRAS